MKCRRHERPLLPVQWMGAVSLLVGAAGCGELGRSDGGALIVRQVLTSSPNAVGPSSAEGGEAPGATPNPVPGTSLGSTLVADSPRALYRRAYDQSRRRADGDSPRERLYAMDAALDQASSDASALAEE